MVKIFFPGLPGTYSPERISENFPDKLARRVQSGVLPRAPKSRNRYVIGSKTKDRMTFSSSGLWTGISVGLNDVEVHLDKNSIPPRILYRVKYWVWTQYCVILGLAIGISIIASRYYLFPGWFAKWGYGQPEFFYSYGEIIFWCILWPWILVALHKKPVSKLLKRIFDEVNQSEK